MSQIKLKLPIDILKEFINSVKITLYFFQSRSIKTTARTIIPISILFRTSEIFTISNKSMITVIKNIPTGNDKPIFSHKLNLGEMILINKKPKKIAKKIPKNAIV